MVCTEIEGKEIPNVELKVFVDGQLKTINTKDLFKGKIVLFGLPGAFTPTCSASHLPQFEQLYDQIKKAGINEIYCTSVNDSFVMDSWAKASGIKKVKMLADGNGELAKALKLLVDKSAIGFGPRSWRYSMIIENNVVKKLFAEEEGSSPDPYKTSDAKTMLKHLDPNAKMPTSCLIFTKPGCPFCTKAIKALTDSGITFAEFSLDDATKKTTVLSALGKTTVPQIFIDGKHVGGSDDLEKFLGSH